MKEKQTFIRKHKICACFINTATRTPMHLVVFLFFTHACAIPYEGSHNSHFHIMNFFRSDRNNFQRKLQAVVSAKLNHDLIHNKTYLI